ncbi:hypothetical protein Tco_1338927 [Tanacetum coccineum]
MVAYLERVMKYAEFHQIVDFLSTCSINYALIVCPTIYASYIEQFWNIATSKTVNSVKQLHAIVDGKAVVISESSMRNDLLFDDEDGITCLHLVDIFENLALMGYEQLSTKTYFSKGGDSVERAITTDVSLVAAQDSDNIIRTQTTAMPNVDIPQGMDTSGGPRQVKSSDDDLDEEDASKQGRTSNKTKPMFKDSDFDDLDDLVDEGMAFVQEKDVGSRSCMHGEGVRRGKGVLVEEEPEKPEKVKRRDQGLAQIESDVELAQILHEEELAELHRAQKETQKQKEATNAALAEEFDEIQARMDVDHELAVRLTHEEQEKYTIEERATLLTEYFEKRKKQLAAERVEEIRNKPPTRAQKVIKKQQQTMSKKRRVENMVSSWLLDEDETVDLSFYLLGILVVGILELRKQDLMDLHRLVMKRFEDNTPEGYNLLLWGDLKVISLIADGWYFDLLQHVSREKISSHQRKCYEENLNWKLEAEAESTMAFALLKFIKGGLFGIMDFYNLVLLIQLDTTGDVLVPLDLSKDTKPYIKLRSLRSVHWDQQVVLIPVPAILVPRSSAFLCKVSHLVVVEQTPLCLSFQLGHPIDCDSFYQFFGKTFGLVSNVTALLISISSIHFMDFFKV